MNAGVQRAGRIAHDACLAGAWLFAVGTLATLVFLIVMSWPGGGQSVIASSTTDGVTYNAIGLTYTGVPGTVLLWFESIVLLAAIALSVLPALRLRRAGHAALVVWASLWFANGIWLTAYGGVWYLWIVWPVLCGAFFLCTVYRAACRWRGGEVPAPSMP